MAEGSITISNAAMADSRHGESFSEFTHGYTLVAGGNLNATNGTLSIGTRMAAAAPTIFSAAVQSGYHYTSAPAADPSTSPLCSRSTTALLDARQPRNYRDVHLRRFAITTCTANAADLNVITLRSAPLTGANKYGQWRRHHRGGAQRAVQLLSGHHAHH